MLTKNVPARVKAAGPGDDAELEEGQFIALASVFNVVDEVGDVVMPGAFTDTLADWKARGEVIPLYWSHRMDDPQMCIGSVLDSAETDTGLQVKAQLDLENPAAAQVYRLLKGRRVGRMSFAYDILDGGWGDRDGQSAYELRKMTLHEVSVVQVPANPDATIQEVKRRGHATKKAIAPHKTDTTDATWDGPANATRLSTDAGASTYRKAYAWVDPDKDADTKAAYKFIHHMVSTDGAVGAANLTACSTGIGVLNGGRGGTTIPDADRQGVYDHLAKHIRDGGGEPPELKAATAVRRKAVDGLDADIAALVAQVDQAVDGCADAVEAADQAVDVLMAALGIPDSDDIAQGDATGQAGRATRVKSGRVLSAKNEQALKSALSKISAGVTDVKSVLAALDSTTDDDDSKASPTQSAAAGGNGQPPTDAPARSCPADVRLRTGLAALLAEANLTN